MCLSFRVDAWLVWTSLTLSTKVCIVDSMCQLAQVAELTKYW